MYFQNWITQILNLVKTKCFEAQNEYEIRKLNGSLGMYETRPRCDDSGDFIARKCQPGGRYIIPYPNSVYLFFKNLNCNFYSCYCVDITNNRIFGESPPNYAATDAAMNCGMCPSQKKETKNKKINKINN